MNRRRPRLKCPVCGYPVRLVKGGRFGWHQVWNGPTDRKPRRVECPGSGEESA